MRLRLALFGITVLEVETGEPPEDEAFRAEPVTFGFSGGSRCEALEIAFEPPGDEDEDGDD